MARSVPPCLADGAVDRNGSMDGRKVANAIPVSGWHRERTERAQTGGDSGSKGQGVFGGKLRKRPVFSDRPEGGQPLSVCSFVS